LKRILVVEAVVVVAIVLCTSFLIADHYQFSSENSSNTMPVLPDSPFYVGVTYCGGNVTDAKLLIDRVKNYTNLFVIQSGLLEKNLTQLNEISTYAIASGLHIIVYFGAVAYNRNYVKDFLNNEKWGSNLLGIYSDDEPGGKTLDSSNFNFVNPKTGYIVSKHSDFLTAFKPDGTRIDYNANGSISIKASDNTSIFYQPDGTIYLTINNALPDERIYVIEANSTVYLLDDNGHIVSQVSDTSKLPKIEPYDQIVAQRPFQTQDDIANSLVATWQIDTSWLRSQTAVKLFTSDYALYWYDYLAGYDVVLAQLGWNQTEMQDIALARGAANVQGKDWGAIITWKYDQQPYLETGQELHDQMRLAYDDGAKYIIVFNFPTYPDNNPYGTLQDQHFLALEKFWNDTVKNKTVTNGGTKAEAVLVLPKNYGWGMRTPKDTIWGIWQPDDKSWQVWSAVQACLARYGSNIDIVYDDSDYEIAGRYQQLYYWNQTI
jgi:hypothetical protein